MLSADSHLNAFVMFGALLMAKQPIPMTHELPHGNSDVLLELLHYPMPYGKYKNQLIRNLPVYYLEWFAQKGFPGGKLGILLQTMYEIRLNGLEYLLDGLKAGNRR